MLRRLGLRLAVSLVATRCTAQQLTSGQGVTLPSNDAFYLVPDALDQVKPGTILRHRAPPQPIVACGPVAACGETPLDLEASHQILYRTTDSNGNATATVLTVLVPRHADMAKVVSYQVAENSANIDCAPSYVSLLGHQGGRPVVDLQTAQTVLDKGFVVILPDFLGPNGAFLANRLAGQATLDGVRAAINSAPFTGISQKPAVTLWGYSGGSHPTLWAAELQPAYAPELAIAGAAVGGLVPNMPTSIAKINGQPSAGLIATALVGLMKQYQELGGIVAQHVLPGYRDKLSYPRHHCAEVTLAEFHNQDILAMFDDRNFLLTNPTVTDIFARNQVGKQTPRIPLLVYCAIDDIFTPIGVTDSLLDGYCAAGANAEYHRVEAVGHSDLALVGAPKALAWLADRMNGTKSQAGCQRNTVQWPRAN